MPADPDGFLVGVNWRGETSAAVTPWMQASQNTAQVFLGINLKCNACHDSFVSKWKLNDAYSLAAYFSPEPKLQLYRCDVALNRFAGAGISISRADADAGILVAGRSSCRRGGHLHRPSNGPDAAHVREPHLAAAARPRSGRQPRRNGRRAMERRACSTGSPAISWTAATTSSGLSGPS